jgi:excisionase family DNA binding protein
MTTVPEVNSEIVNGDDNQSPLSKSQPLWTVKDAAEYLRLKPETVRLMARRGELPSIKVGKRLWRFRPGEIKDWLNLHS